MPPGKRTAQLSDKLPVTLRNLNCPRKGPPRCNTPVYRAFVYMSFRVLSYGILTQCSPRGAPIERDVPFSENNFIYLSEFKVNEPPSFNQPFAYREEPVSEPSFAHNLEPQKKDLMFKQYLKLLSNSQLKKPLSKFQITGNRCSVSRAKYV